MAKKFKRKGSKFKIIIYASLLIISFYISGYILFYSEGINFKNFILDSTINKFKKDKPIVNDSIASKLTNPEDIIYSSLNKVVTKEDLLLYTDSLDDNFNYDTSTSEYVEDPNPIQVDKPIVYITNTHQLEEYDMPSRQDYSIKPNVMIASYVLKEKLNDLGVPAIVETNNIKEYLNKHKLSYEYSYEASRYYAKEKMKQYPTIKYVIDLHRDAAKLKNTLYKSDGKEYARIMFVSGHNYKNYKKNLAFMEELNKMFDTKHKGFSRGIFTRSSGRFNQDLTTKTVLIELGGVDNSIEQVYNSAEIIAQVLSEYIKEENEK